MDDLDVPEPLDARVRSLLALWDTTASHVAALDGMDWDLPIPDGVPGSDVAGLVTHLTGVHYAGPHRLQEATGTARDRAAARLRASTPSARTLSAQCLDMCLHTHDLALAVRAPFDLEACEPAALAACRLLLAVAPRLLLANGERDAEVQVLVRSGAGRTPVVERTVRVHDGAPGGSGPGGSGPGGSGTGAPPDRIELTAAALLLLLSGRRDADDLAAAGLAEWAGEAADRFVHRAPLVGAGPSR